ncbi:MAG: lipoyl(octanoyl) transferase LipB [Thermoplasmata archaeon]|nr:lipoyl(octanoyl) transferase LipB [Thermoplasmata archaeon]
MPPAHREWGVREYGDALAEMRRLRQARRRGEIPDTLLLVEHLPVYTIGVQGDGGDTFPPDVPVFRVERGGKGTYHGPGQLVGYPIVDLAPRGRDVRRFVHDVEELVVRAVGELGVAAERVDGRRGVWVEGERKIASVGVAIEEWVSSHGFGLNVSTDLRAFSVFHPCGFDGSVMTSVSRELDRPVQVAEVVPSVLRAWDELFGEPSTARGAVPAAVASVPGA